MSRWTAVAFCALAVLVAFLISGCQFGRGFTDQMAADGPTVLADVLDKKLGDDFKSVTEAIGGIKIPPPSTPADPKEQGLLYSLGTLAALMVSNGLRGYIREKKGSKPA